MLGRDGTIVTCSIDAKRFYVQHWDISDGRLLRTRLLQGMRIKANAEPLFGISLAGVSHNGRFLVLTLEGQRVWYDLEADALLAAGSYVTPDGQKVLSLNPKERTLTITDRDGRSQKIPVPVDEVRFDWSVDGQTMFTANVDATFSCWDSLSGQERARFNPGMQSITQMAVSPRGDAVALADDKGGVAVVRASFPATGADASSR